MQHPLTQARKVRQAVLPGDELAVEHEAVRKLGEFGNELGQVPASPRADAQAVVRTDDRAEPVPLDLIEPPLAAR